MKRRIRHILTVLLLAFAGCAVLDEPPAPGDIRTVSPVVSRTKMVVFREPMVLGDQRPLLTKGIGFPSGIYVIEAEDSQYYYFRAPKPLEYRTFRRGETTKDRFRQGGLYWSKFAIDPVPAGAYLSGKNCAKKTLVWKLGSDFLSGQGTRWTKNF